MARQVKLQTREMGDLHLLLVRSVAGEWESDWAALRDSPYAEFLTRIEKETLDHALHGWTSPLVKKLGPSPQMILHRLSPDNRQCALWADCVFYRKRDCVPKAPKMPSCFEPRDLPTELGQEMLRVWRESVYIVLVEETA